MSDDVNCQHLETWFSRTVYPEPCGEMHTYCTACGTPLGGCPFVDAPEWPQYTVDHAANAAYVALTERAGRVDRVVQLGYGINVDLDAEGVPLGYEILNLHPSAPYARRKIKQPGRLTSESLADKVGVDDPKLQAWYRAQLEAIEQAERGPFPKGPIG